MMQTLSYLRALHDARQETFLEVTNIIMAKSKLLIGTETSFRRALISNNCHLYLREL